MTRDDERTHRAVAGNRQRELLWRSKRDEASPQLARVLVREHVHILHLRQCRCCERTAVCFPPACTFMPCRTWARLPGGKDGWGCTVRSLKKLAKSCSVMLKGKFFRYALYGGWVGSRTWGGRIAAGAAPWLGGLRPNSAGSSSGTFSNLTSGTAASANPTSALQRLPPSRARQ